MLGLTYKPGTSTLRRSASVDIALRLMQAGALVMAHDPQADVAEVAETGIHRLLTVTEAAHAAEAILVLTPWPEYKELDFYALAKTMKRPLLIDAQNALDSSRIQEAGFTYLDIGRGR